MKYFQEFPNIQYNSFFTDKQSNDDVILAKNIFKRPKLSSTVSNASFAYEYYYIQNNERPDQIAEKVYGNSQLDWVILITNDITNVNDKWPLETDSFYNYLLDKYGSEENINAIHHYETLEKRDEYDRVVIPSGLQIDPRINFNVVTGVGVSEYAIGGFPNTKTELNVTVNLNQFLTVKKRSETVNIIITDNQIYNSFLNIESRNDNNPIKITNDLTKWPSGWGGTLEIIKRNNEKTVISIGNTIFNNDILINKSLYEISLNSEIQGPVIKLTSP
jgi:hypothetical protein